MSLKTFISQCRKRRIFKGFSIYAISSWIIIQVAATTFPYLGVPKQAVTLIIILVLIGLPISLIFSWYYNVVVDELDEVKELSKLSNKAVSNIFKVIILVISMVVIAVVALLVNRNFKSEIKRISSNRIAVIDFKNSTGNPEHELLGKVIADWIEYGIIQNDLATVVSSEIINNYSGLLKTTEELGSSNNVLNKLSVETTITGGIYKDGASLIAKCSVYQWPDSQASFAFDDIEIDPNNPNEGINKLKNKVLGYLHISDSKALQLQENPPNYEAYKLVLKAKDLINNLDSSALDLLEQALQLDSNYFEAKVLKLSYYYSTGEFQKADSLRLTIVPESRSNSRQVNLLNFYNALLNGRNKTIYNTWKREYDYAPFNLTTNQNMMVIAQQYVFRPWEIEDYYKEIDMSGLDFSGCPACIFRAYIQALAFLELKKYRKVITLLEPQLTVDIPPNLLRALISAYVRSGKINKLHQLFDELPNLLINADLTGLYLKAVKELLIAREVEKAREYLQKVKNRQGLDKESYMMARILFLEESFTGAEAILENLYSQGKLGLRGKSDLAICYQLNKKTEEAGNMVREIQELEGKYDFGNVKYNLARIEAYKQNDEKVLAYLKESVSKGYIYGPEEFHNDLAFQKYKDSAAFKKLLSYWH